MLAVLVATLPATAIEQSQTTQKVSTSEVTTASEDDFVLGVYGNANEDDTIDMRDLTYVKLIFFGKKTDTELADAKYDGKINPLDFIQIKLIIVGKEKELTVVDDAGRIVTVKKPITRIIALSLYPAEAIRMFGEKDKVVGVYHYLKKQPVYFPELSKLSSVRGYPWDYEAILSLEPDLVVTWKYHIDELEEKLAGIPAVGLCFYKPDTFVGALKKLGYILDAEDSVENYLGTYHDKYIGLVKDRTMGLPAENRPKVYVEGSKSYKTYGAGSGADLYTKIAGARNIFSDLSGYPEVDPEEVMVRNPDVIIKYLSRYYKYDVGYEADDLSTMKEIWGEIMSRPELQNVTAVKNGQVHVIDAGMTYGLDYPVAIVYMAKWFHPELFSDLDPQAIHQEFVDRFCPGLDFDVIKHGAFVYPAN